MDRPQQQHNNRRNQQKKTKDKGGRVKNLSNDLTKEGGRVIKEKFKEERNKRTLPLKAQNDRQKMALRAFTDSQLVIQTGYAGVGKTELMCWWACKQWLEGNVDNIIITRPYQQLGRDAGATKGNDAEKLLPFCMSMLMKLKKYLGTGPLKNNFKLDGFDTLFSEADGIQIIPVEKIQGLSFSSKTIILADEIQNSTIPQVKALATRVEEGCQLLISGDPRQSAIGDKNGLNYLVHVLNKRPYVGAEIIEYKVEDNCRKGIASHLVRAFDELDGNW